MTPTVLKHGIGYDLVVVQDGKRLVLAIRCHACQRISYHPKDVRERYCGACHAFHEEHLLGQQA
jgi:hypothetical protein